MGTRRLLAAGALSFLLAACGGSDADSASTADESVEYSESGDAAAPRLDEPAEVSASASQDSTTAGRLIARTGYVNVLVDDLDQSISEATAIGAAKGGFVAQEQTSRHSSELTFKVPGDKFDATLAAFGELGSVDSQWVTTEDRTTQIVDLRARLETAEASLARTRELFDAATTVTELVTAEHEIAQREQTVEVLKAQLRSQEESVSLATITVYMTIDPDSLPEEPVVSDEDLPTLRRAFNNGLNLLWYLVRVVGITIAWLLPWIPVVALAVLAGRYIRRRLAARPPKPAKVATYTPPQYSAPTVANPPPPNAPMAAPSAAPTATETFRPPEMGTDVRPGTESDAADTLD